MISDDRCTYSWFTSTNVLVTNPQKNDRTRIIMSQSKPLDLLFDPALIPSKVQSLLGDDLLVSSVSKTAGNEANSFSAPSTGIR